MTDEQWHRITTWAASQLRKKRKRAIAPEDLALRFNLREPFWPALRKRATLEKARFTVRKPKGKIEFRRMED